MSLGALGTTIAFEVSSSKILTWATSRRTQAPRWHKHDVYAAKPVQEFIGPDLDGYSMAIRLDINHGVDPSDQLKKIRDKAKAGEVLQLTIGGTLIGDFVIKNMDEELVRFSRGGTLTLAHLNLTLEEYA